MATPQRKKNPPAERAQTLLHMLEEEKLTTMELDVVKVDRMLSDLMDLHLEDEDPEFDCEGDIIAAKLHLLEGLLSQGTKEEIAPAKA